MNTFLHGGRIGDCIYALYTVKALGGGTMYLSQHHRENWSPAIADALLPLLNIQPYIHFAGHREFHPDAPIMHDLIDAERRNNPEDFPEWKGPHFPGNVHIAKRYAREFGVKWEPNEPWLDAPMDFPMTDVVVHAPQRRMVRPATAYAEILRGLLDAGRTVTVIGAAHDYAELMPLIQHENLTFVQLHSVLHMANIIASSHVFFGTVSSGHAIAEGLGHRRYIEAAPGCDNVLPTEFVNDLTERQVVEKLNAAFKESDDEVNEIIAKLP